MLKELGSIAAAMAAMLVVYWIIHGHYSVKQIYLDMLDSSDPGSGTYSNARAGLEKLESDEGMIKGLMVFFAFLAICTLIGIFQLLS